MKYIFVAGAPGSKWSSVVKNIYYSSSIDQSDYSEDRTYYHDASGTMDLMHIGAYFDPGMEFDLPESMSTLTKVEAESKFDRAFAANSTGVKIIKSHIFSYAHNIDYLRELWPDCPVVTVYRGNDACLGWWVKCGEFEITYPQYRDYYKNLREMAKIIAKQNQGICTALHRYPSLYVEDNLNLAKHLGLKNPPDAYQHYQTSDVDVRIIK